MTNTCNVKNAISTLGSVEAMIGNLDNDVADEDIEEEWGNTLLLIFDRQK